MLEAWCLTNTTYVVFILKWLFFFQKMQNSLNVIYTNLKQLSNNQYKVFENVLQFFKLLKTFIQVQFCIISDLVCSREVMVMCWLY